MSMSIVLMIMMGVIQSLLEDIGSNDSSSNCAID